MSGKTRWSTRRTKSTNLNAPRGSIGQTNGSRLSDGDLLARQSTAIALLEIHWAELGWDVSRIRSRDDVIRVFSVHSLVHESIFELLRSPGKESNRSVSILRHEFEEVNEHVGVSYRTADSIRELRQRIERALCNSSPSAELELKIHYERLGKELEEAEREHRRLCDLAQSLRLEKRLAEAAFSQDEVVRLVRERRYTLSPFTLACTIGGSPFIKYRQSLTRCQRLGARNCGHLRYELFRAIAHICDHYDEREADVAKLVRTLPASFSSAREELKKNFYSFRRAFAEGWTNTTRRRAQLPYSITAHYNRLTTSMSLIDELHARNERLL